VKKDREKNLDVQQKLIKRGVGNGGSKSEVVGTGRRENTKKQAHQTADYRGIAELKRSYFHC
jgi:hypothetical protein